MPVDSSARVTNKILAHYDANARVLPWRSPPGSPPTDAYRVWLSEIMLQQTQVAAVIPYYEQFTRRWPNVEALAAAEDADVMAAWAGLGYYARARNLLACARMVATEFDGAFPATEKGLRALPGIGAYTAAAIAAIAFGERAVVVDGNVERVVARLNAVTTPMPKAKPELNALTDAITPDARAGDFAQAMMDLGATICRPRNPDCERCPISGDCLGRENAEGFPVKAPRRERLHRTGTAFWMERDGHVLLVRRPDPGMLAGMRALPSTGWDGRTEGPLPKPGRELGKVDHAFTHFALSLRVAETADTDAATALGGEWWPIDQLDEAGLPSLFAKAARAAIKGRKSSCQSS